MQEFNPADAFCAFVNAPAIEVPKSKPTYDPWQRPDPFMGVSTNADIDFDVPLQPADAGPDPFRRSAGSGRFQLGHITPPATEKYYDHER